MPETAPSTTRSPEDPAEVDVAIIGAGIAGLSAAITARQAGYSVRVFESQDGPGGLCTSWTRNGYVFDYSADFLFGSSPVQGFHRQWQRLGVLGDIRFRHIESFGEYQGPGGEIMRLYTDPGLLQVHLTELSPGDAAPVRQFCKAVRRIRRFQLTRLSFGLGELPQILGSLPSLAVVARWSRVTVRDWCAGLANPLLRSAFSTIAGADTPLGALLLVLGMMHRHGAACPEGGSLSLARVFESKARDLGASFAYRTAVQRISHHGGQVQGVELRDGRFQKARMVVGACDLHHLLHTLLDGSFSLTAYDQLFSRGELYEPVVQVSLGVRLDPRWDLPHRSQNIHLPLPIPVAIGPRQEESLLVRHYCHDRSMSPESCTSLVVRFGSPFDWWRELRNHPEAYRQAKKQILDAAIGALEQHFPGLAARVEATDVATPHSTVRYTGVWRGSIQGWKLTAELMGQAMKGTRLPLTVPGLAGLALAGQWTEPGGGIPPAARSGIEALECLIRQRGKKKYPPSARARQPRD